MTEKRVSRMCEDKSPDLKMIFGILSKHFNSRATFYLMEAVEGGHNESWPRILELISERDILRDENYEYLKGVIYERQANRDSERIQ